MTTETPSDWETTVVAPFMRAVTGGGVSPVRVIQDIVRGSEAFGDEARDMFANLQTAIVERARAHRAFAKSAGEAMKEQSRGRPDPVEVLEAAKTPEEQLRQFNDAIKRIESAKMMDPAKVLEVTKAMEEQWRQHRAALEALEAQRRRDREPPER